MKKTILICLLFLVLIGCSNNDSQKLSGKEVYSKLKKNGIVLEDDAYNSKYIMFSLSEKNDPFVLYIYYSDGETIGFEIDESQDEASDSYTYDMDNGYSYVYLFDEDCSYYPDNKTPDGEKVCTGGNLKKAKRVYNKCYKELLKKIGITKEDLITFGNWYSDNNYD